MAKKLSRRELLKNGLLGFAAVSATSALTACGGGGDGDSADDGNSPNSVKAQFKHGVASGDPLQDRVILWTRITPDNDADKGATLRVTWEIATDSGFTQNLKTGTVDTNANQDFTVKVDVTGLKAGQKYYYCFKYGEQTSLVGETKTLPAVTDQVKFAVCTCANYPAGYFNAYKEMAKGDFDVVIHLGDYIYEYGYKQYGTDFRDNFTENNRYEPRLEHEAVKLEDYRARYALYHEDKDLQAVHAKFPFIAVWDDHEVANDAWQNGAENHNPDEGEGNYSDRKAHALQAYFEWLPIRPKNGNDHVNIYRQFNFGNLVQLNMLDTRHLARSVQLAYKDFFPNGDASSFTPENIAKFTAAMKDMSRTMLGVQQKEWFLDNLKRSQAKWNVIGQQVLMSKIDIPVPLALPAQKIQSILEDATHIADQNMRQAYEASAHKIYQEELEPRISGLLGALAVINNPSIPDSMKTQAKEALAQAENTVPFNLDAWDGYAVEREILYTMFQTINKKVVVLAGDSHNAWQSDLRTRDGAKVGVEFATTSISSPGMEEYLGLKDLANPAVEIGKVQQAFTTFVKDLNYCDLSRRGYLAITFDQSSVKAEYYYVDVKTKGATASLDKTVVVNNELEYIPA